MEMYFNVQRNMSAERRRRRIFKVYRWEIDVNMCLAVLAQLKEIKDNIAVADFDGLTQEIRLDLIEEPKVGEWMLIHTGFAIQRVDEKEAMEMKKIMDEIAAINAGEEPQNA